MSQFINETHIAGKLCSPIKGIPGPVIHSVIQTKYGPANKSYFAVFTGRGGYMKCEVWGDEALSLKYANADDWIEAWGVHTVGNAFQSKKTGEWITPIYLRVSRFVYKEKAYESVERKPQGFPLKDDTHQKRTPHQSQQNDHPTMVEDDIPF